MSDQPSSLKPTSVKLAPDQWAELFENITLAEKMIPGRDRREHDRHEYSAQVTLYAEFNDDDPSCGEQRYLVRTRNVSASGLGFIHDAEVCVGAVVKFTVFDLKGRAHDVTAVSARADLIESGVWDIGVKFDELINPADFVDADGQPLVQAG